MTIPAVVFRSDEYGALNIVRTLGRMGVAVHCVDDDPVPLCAHSRHCRSVTRWTSESATAHTATDWLLDYARRFDKAPVLIPTYDGRNLLIDQIRSALREAYLLPAPAPGAMARVYDKTSLAALCVDAGLATPACTLPASLAEARAAAKDMRFPLLLKGVDPDRLEIHCGFRLRRIESMDELEHCWTQLDDGGPPNVMLQEFIVGQSWALAGYVGRDGRLQFAATGRKLRQLPLEGGITAKAVCDENPVLVDLAQHIANASGYRGAMGLDLLHDPRDDRYHLVDFNPRLGANFAAFVDVDGNDAARAWYLDMIGQPLTERRASATGRVWAVEHKLLTVLRLTRNEAGPAWRAMLRECREVDQWAHWDPDDRRPGLTFGTRTLRNALSRRTTPSRR